MLRPTLAICCLLMLSSTCSAAVFQYATEVNYRVEKRGEIQERTARALLWVPPDSEQIQGILLSGLTSAEADVVRDQRIRAACAELDLAIIFLTCGLSQPDLTTVIADLATTSGYQELRIAPWIPVGHSAGGPQAQRLARRHPERTIGLIQYRGGMPSAEAPLAPGIPSLAMMGEFDEFWGTQRNADGSESWNRAQGYIASYRAADQAHLGSFLAEPGAGHFAWSDANAIYLADWLRAAVPLRLPTWDPANGAPTLIAIDPATGWLTDFDLTSNTPIIGPAGAYPGDATRTSWHPSEAVARASIAYHDGIHGKHDQFIRWQDRTWVDAGVRHFFQDPKWVDDGATFQIHPVYAQRVPQQVNNQGPKWPHAGEPVGASEAPIQAVRVGGPVTVVGPDRLRITFDNVFPGYSTKIMFMARSPGDETYRATEQIGMLSRGFKGLRQGASQTISMTPLPETIAASSEPLPLEASSDAGLPVRFFVKQGPAVVENGVLVIRDVPARATYPIPVVVVAYQPGSGAEPRVKAAQRIVHTLAITAP